MIPEGSNDKRLTDVGTTSILHHTKISCYTVGLLKHLQRGKDPGPDGNLNEMIVYGGCRLIESLTQLMNIAIEEECVPADWRKSRVMPLNDISGVGTVAAVTALAATLFRP